ncbi:MAG: hypothetical protein ABEJ73_08745 [Haloplanus sp.]
MPAPPTLDADRPSGDTDGVPDATRVSPVRLDRRLHDCGVAVAERELATAFAALDDLTPAQRRVVAVMAGRIAAGVLAPARAAVDDDATAVARLFDPERIRDER